MDKIEINNKNNIDMKHINMKHIILALALAACTFSLHAQGLSQLEVSPNGHYLQTTDSTPFFYLADTAWELFHKLNREEAQLFLKDRAAKGFNVVQAVALAELDGIGQPNAYGHFPLKNNDPSQPATVEGPQNDYWDHVDYIVNQANAVGIYVGLLPTWGRWWKDGGAIFNAKNAEQYGQWIAKRYQNNHIIWILGGDRNPDSADEQAIIRAMAKGIRKVDTHSLITFHPTGWTSSSKWFHRDEWLSMNGRQSGHNQRAQSNEQIRDDFHRQPTKPILELEPLYEDHPLEFDPEREGHSIAWDTRRAMYWSAFNGAAGVAYGHHSVWQMYDPQKSEGINNPLLPWQEALQQPAATQAVHLKKLLLSRPYFDRIPCPELIQPHRVHTAIPGAGRYTLAATMDTNATYAMIYTPTCRPFAVNTHLLGGAKLVAWWYSPRTGTVKRIGTFAQTAQPKTFNPPSPGEAQDWVLVIDNASCHYPKPGKSR